jgi:hypothetical protein
LQGGDRCRVDQTPAPYLNTFGMGAADDLVDRDFDAWFQPILLARPVDDRLLLVKASASGDAGIHAGEPTPVESTGRKRATRGLANPGDPDFDER